MNESYLQFTLYKGYTLLFEATGPGTRRWGAWLGAECWFSGDSAREVQEKINAALAECP